ncbi:hypothetical protein A7K73_04640 [Candidatus Methylacidiphilum fumarolicum]|nr:hypothetical protein A7K73_04640 [Candidatus Methylacidiphilum fumarolicum]TFE75923.1 hypothetical protein A7D33_01320 [Candidatus Methylacidiphilum fumarolicum]
MAYTTSKKRIGDPKISLRPPQNRLHAILLERFSRRNGKPPDWKPNEGEDYSKADHSRQGLTAADGREAGAIAIAICGSGAGSSIPRRFPREGIGLSNPRGILVLN